MTEREKIVEVMATSARDHEWRGLNGPDWNAPGEKEYWLGMAEHLLTALEASGMAVVQNEQAPVFAFLLGEGPLDGTWFGEPRKPTYWWRKYLRAALPASPTPSMTENADEHDDVGN